MLKRVIARSWIWRNMSVKRKLAIKRRYNRLDKMIADRFFGYDRSHLMAALRKLGVADGDTVMVHSSFRMNSGFKGTAQDIIDCLLEAVGPSGNLLMVSLAYGSSSLEYLMTQPTFDVRKTPSMMGFISETFRRRSGVARSLSPVHPVLAFGEKSAWIVEGHEKCLYPCGEGSPFEKLKLLNGKVLFYNVAFPFTFFHHIEHLMRDRLSVPLYTEKPIPAKVVNYQGEAIVVNSFVFPKRIYSTRRTRMLKDRLLKESLLKKVRIGRGDLKLVKADDALHCTSRMLDEGIDFYPQKNE